MKVYGDIGWGVGRGVVYRVSRWIGDKLDCSVCDKVGEGVEL